MGLFEEVYNDVFSIKSNIGNLSTLIEEASFEKSEILSHCLEILKTEVAQLWDKLLFKESERKPAMTSVSSFSETMDVKSISTQTDFESAVVVVPKDVAQIKDEDDTQIKSTVTADVDGIQMKSTVKSDVDGTQTKSTVKSDVDGTQTKSTVKSDVDGTQMKSTVKDGAKTKCHFTSNMLEEVGKLDERGWGCVQLASPSGYWKCCFAGQSTNWPALLDVRRQWVFGPPFLLPAWLGGVKVSCRFGWPVHRSGQLELRLYVEEDDYNANMTLPLRVKVATYVGFCPGSNPRIMKIGNMWVNLDSLGCSPVVAQLDAALLSRDAPPVILLRFIQ